MDYESQLKVGQYAETSKCEGQSSSSWIEAKILDVEWANGRARFNISFIDEKEKSRILIINEDYTKDIALDGNRPLIRPRPPSTVYCISESGEKVWHPLVKESWQAGDVVEVRYGSCWRPGRVVEMSCTKEKMVYFSNGSNIKVDSSTEIRAQVTWTGKSWFLVNNETPNMDCNGSFKNKFKPFIGEGVLSPNREKVTEFVTDIFTEHPSFARAIQKKCLGRNGKMPFPVMFMTEYLSGSQDIVIFEDNDGRAWTVEWTSYMQSGRRLVFTTGWHEFASHHNAKDGDVLLVEFLNPKSFRVQILPTNYDVSTKEPDASISKREAMPNRNDFSEVVGRKDNLPSAQLQVFEKTSVTVDQGFKTREEKPTYVKHGRNGTPQQIHSKQNIDSEKVDKNCAQYRIGDSKHELDRQTRSLCDSLSPTKVVNGTKNMMDMDSFCLNKQSYSELCHSYHLPSQEQNGNNQMVSIFEREEPPSLCLDLAAARRNGHNLCPKIQRNPNLCPKIQRNPVNVTEGVVGNQLIVGGSKQIDSAILSNRSRLLGSEKPESGVKVSTISNFLPVSGNRQNITGGRQHVASFCQSSMENCSEYVLCGFQFCILHILEDPLAPYKQCDFVMMSSGQRCRFPVSLSVADMRFCQIHKQMGLPNSRSKSIIFQENLCCGRMSLLVLAATVAHHDLECFCPPKMWKSMKTNFADDSGVANPLQEARSSPQLSISLVNVLQHEQLNQAHEDAPSDGQPGANMSVGKKSGHYGSGMVGKTQSGDQMHKVCESPVHCALKVSESSNTFESVRGNSNSTGRNVTKLSRYWHSPDSSSYEDLSSEHAKHRSTRRVECDVSSHMNEIECTSSGLCIKKTLFKNENFGGKSYPNVTATSPKNMLRDGTYQVCEKGVRLPSTAPCLGSVATRSYFLFHGMPSLVDIGPIDLTRIGLMWTPARLLQCNGKNLSAKCPDELQLMPIMDLGELDFTTMGLKYALHDTKRNAGISNKQKQRLDTKELIPHGHFRVKSISQFVGVRRRPWGAYGAEIQTPEGKRLWLGTYPTEEAAAQAYDDTTHILRGKRAVNNFSQLSEADSIVEPSRSCTEQRSMFGEAPKRRRSAISQKRGKEQLLLDDREAKRWWNLTCVKKRPLIQCDSHSSLIYGNNTTVDDLEMDSKSSGRCANRPTAELEKDTARHLQELCGEGEEGSKVINRFDRLYSNKQKLKRTVDLNSSGISVSLPESIMDREETADSFVHGICHRKMFKFVSTAMTGNLDMDSRIGYSNAKKKQNENNLVPRYDHSDLVANDIDVGEQYTDEIVQDKTLTDSENNFSNPEQNGYIEKVENESHFYGVRKTASGRFEASLYDRNRKKKIYVGVYDSMIEAARARDQKAIELGAASVLNFPELLKQTDLKNENGMLGSTSDKNLFKIQSIGHKNSVKDHVIIYPEKKVGRKAANFHKLPKAKRSKMTVRSDVIKGKISSIQEPKLVNCEEQDYTLLQNEETEVKDVNACSLAFASNSLQIGKNGHDTVNTYAMRGKKKRKSISEYVDFSFSESTKKQNGQKLSQLSNHCSRVRKQVLAPGLDIDHIIESEYARVYKTTSKWRAMQSRRGRDQGNLLDGNEKVGIKKEIIEKYESNVVDQKFELYKNESEDCNISPVSQHKNAKLHSPSDGVADETGHSWDLNVHKCISDAPTVTKAEDHIFDNNPFKREKDPDTYCTNESKGSFFAMLPTTKVKKSRSARGLNANVLHPSTDSSLQDQSSQERTIPIIQQSIQNCRNHSQRRGKAGRSRKCRQSATRKRSGFTSHIDYRGVYSNGKKFQSIYYNPVSKKHTYLGTFSTGEDAARAYDQVAYEQLGTSAKLNFSPNLLELKDRQVTNQETGMHAQLEQTSGSEKVTVESNVFSLEQNQVDYERPEFVLEDKASTSDCDHDHPQPTKSNIRCLLDTKETCENEDHSQHADLIPGLLVEKPDMKGHRPLRRMTFPFEEGKSTCSSTEHPDIDSVDGVCARPAARAWGELLKASEVLSFSEDTEPHVQRC